MFIFINKHLFRELQNDVVIFYGYIYIVRFKVLPHYQV